jgi:hypothetical protein
MPIDHGAVVIDNFMGFYKRGDPEACPLDHFQDCNNIQYLTARGFRTRDGIDIYPAVSANVYRIYTYVKQDSESLLILDDTGNLFDTGSPTPNTPILSLPGVGFKDFGFTSYAGRAYISPNNGFIGLLNQFVYVYKGDGVATTARKAAGFGPTAAPVAADGAAGHVEKGYHVYAVVFETDTGFLTKMGPGVALNSAGGTEVDISSVQVSPDPAVIKRHIVATKAVDPTLFDGNLTGYQFFFVPGGTINDNSTTTITVNFYDEDLLEDASYLLDILEEIPAGLGLAQYHGRMVQFGEHPNQSLLRFSNEGEPESFDAVTGLVIFPLDGTTIQNGVEYRDVFYAFKISKTASITDNGGDPSSWPVVIIDNGLGTHPHGIATILDSNGINIDFLVIANISGLFVFNGFFQRPELSYKIKDYWDAFATTLDLQLLFRFLQILDDTLTMSIYIVMPDGTMLYCNHQQGLDAKNVRWAPWTFDVSMTAVALINRSTIVLGASDPHP